VTDGSRGATQDADAARFAWRSDGVAALVVGLFALALRLTFLFASPDRAWPHSLRYEGDAPVWARWADALSRGQPFEFDLPLRTPGVAFLLHALGFDAAPFTGAKVLWCVLSAATCSSIWLLAARCVSRRAAWIAAGWLALSNASLQLATSLNNEAPYALLVVALVGGALWARGSGSIVSALLVGAAHGLALLLRAEHALLFALLTLWTVAGPSGDASRMGSRVKWAAASALTALAVCAPWIWRSHEATVRFNRVGPTVDFARLQPTWSAGARAAIERLPPFAREGNAAFLSHLARQAGKASVEERDVDEYFEREWGYTPEPLSEWTLVSSKGALDFALANHPDAHGVFSRAGLNDGRDPDPEFAFGRPSHLKLHQHGFALGWSWIRADPATWGSALLGKLERFVGGVTLGLGANDWPHGPASVRGAVDLALPADPAPAWSWIVGAACAIGAVLARRTQLGRVLWIVVAYKLAITVAFYGYARQAASIEPVWRLFGAFAVDAVLVRVAPHVLPSQIARRTLAWAFAVALAIAALVDSARPVALQASPLQVAPQRRPEWGPDAFECWAPVRLTPLAPH